MQVTMQQLILDLLPDQTPALSHFLPGNNVELLAALENWLKQPVQAYPGNLFVIWGPTGCGKSFLSQCMVSAGFSPAGDAVNRAPLRVGRWKTPRSWMPIASRICSGIWCGWPMRTAPFSLVCRLMHKQGCGKMSARAWVPDISPGTPG